MLKIFWIFNKMIYIYFFSLFEQRQCHTKSFARKNWARPRTPTDGVIRLLMKYAKKLEKKKTLLKILLLLKKVSCNAGVVKVTRHTLTSDKCEAPTKALARSSH